MISEALINKEDVTAQSDARTFILKDDVRNGLYMVIRYAAHPLWLTLTILFRHARIERMLKLRTRYLIHSIFSSETCWTVPSPSITSRVRKNRLWEVSEGSK